MERSAVRTSAYAVFHYNAVMHTFCLYNNALMLIDIDSYIDNE